MCLYSHTHTHSHTYIACSVVQDFYFLIDTTSSNDGLPFCSTMYSLELLITAINPGSTLSTSRIGAYFYPREVNSEEDLMRFFGIGDVGCDAAVTKFHHLTREFSFGVQKGYKEKIRGSITYPKGAIDLLRSDLAEEIMDNQALKSRRRIVLIMTDGGNDGNSDELRDSIHQLVQLSPGNITLIVGGLASVFNAPDLTAYQNGLTVLANGVEENAIVATTSQELSEKIVVAMEANGAICASKRELM